MSVVASVVFGISVPTVSAVPNLDTSCIPGVDAGLVGTTILDCSTVEPCNEDTVSDICLFTTVDLHFKCEDAAHKWAVSASESSDGHNDLHVKGWIACGGTETTVKCTTFYSGSDAQACNTEGFKDVTGYNGEATLECEYTGTIPSPWDNNVSGVCEAQDPFIPGN